MQVKRILITMLMATIILSTPIMVQAKTTTTVVSKQMSKTEKRIKSAAKEYAKGHKKGFRYESEWEILEENHIKVTKKNAKLMRKWVKYYEKR